MPLLRLLLLLLNRIWYRGEVTWRSLYACTIPVASCWKVLLVPRRSLLSNRVSCFGHQRDLLSTLSSMSCHPLCHLQSFVILIALSGCSQHQGNAGGSLSSPFTGMEPSSGTLKG